METGLSGQVILITGAAGGIGRAAALAFAGEGARPALADINLAAADRLAVEASALGTEAIACRADVSDQAAVQALVAEVNDRLGPVDVLVNNAGIFQSTPIEEITVADWDRLLAVNLRGVLLCSQAVLPGMKARRRGRIINIASMAGQVGGIRAGAHYAASKAGVISLTKSLAKAAAPYAITVNCINPGVIDTDMTRAWPQAWRDELVDQTPLRRLGTAEDVAGAILFLASSAAAFVHGAQIDVNGGLHMD
jgi:NAD(P)-dependent dehydrogenase (short-subunit alcohol dehydrogenase family)